MMRTRHAQHGQSLTEYMVMALAIITAIIALAAAHFQGMANRLMGTNGQTGVAFQLRRTGNGTADNFLQ